MLPKWIFVFYAKENGKIVNLIFRFRRCEEGYFHMENKQKIVWRT